MAYWQIEPWGAWRDNWHSAQIAALLYNTFRSKKSDPMALREFMYRDSDTERENKTRTTVNWLRAMAKGGSDGK